MNSFDRMARVLAALSLSGWCMMQSAQAQTVEQFYKGKTITMLVGTAPGGINDISARFVGRWFGQFIPGKPNIVVQNTPVRSGEICLARKPVVLCQRCVPDAHQCRPSGEDDR